MNIFYNNINNNNSYNYYDYYLIGNNMVIKHLFCYAFVFILSMQDYPIFLKIILDYCITTLL